MLTRMKIKGFRSFSQDSYQEINFSKLAVLVGQNNAGKSNILKAIKFALDPTDASILREDFSIRRSKSKSKRIGYTDKKARQIEILLYFNDINLLPKKYHKIARKREFELKVSVSGSRLGEFEKKYFIDNKDIKKMRVNKNYEKENVYKELLKNFSIHIAPTIRDIEYLEIFKEMLPLAGRSDIKKIIRGFTEEISKKMKPKLSVMRKQLGVNNAEFKPNVDVEKLLYDTRFDFIIDEGYHVPIKNVGQGYISKSIISLAMKSKKNVIIGIEEPELHMHPNAVIDLLKEIKNENKQVIMTSHSPTITNFVEPKEIIVVQKVDRYSNGYQMEKLFEEQFEDYNNIKRQIFLNRQKTDLLFAKGIILVEGHYDRIAYEIISEKSKINLTKNGISIIDAKSDSNFLPYMLLADAINLKWVILADQLAAHNANETQTGYGNYIKQLHKHKYISEQEANNLIRSINNNYQNYGDAIKSINRKLKRSKGKVIFLRGKDLSDEVVNSVENMPYRNVKLLFQKFRGSKYDKDKTRVKNVCERKIRKKDWDMITAIEVIPTKYLNNFEHLLRDAYNFIIKD